MYNYQSLSNIVSRVHLELPADEWVRVTDSLPRSAVTIYNPGPASVLLMLVPRGAALPESVEPDAVDYRLQPNRTLEVAVSGSLDIAAALPPDADPQPLSSASLAL